MEICKGKITKTLFWAIFALAFFSCSRGKKDFVPKRQGGDEIRCLFVTPYKKADVSSFIWLSALSREYGLTLNWSVMGEDEWESKKEEALSSAFAPDLLINATKVEDYALHNAFFANLADFIGFDTQNLSILFKEHKDAVRAATLYNGAIYALPSFSAVDNQKAYSHQTKCVLFINQQLLKNLSLKSPETFSEFENTLDFFSKNSIEIPFDFCGWDGNEHSAVMLLGGLGIQLTNGGRNGYFLENNTIKNYFSDTRYKYLLKTLSRWYKKGLIKDISLSSDLESFLSRSHGNSKGEAIVASAIGTEETAQFGKKLSSQYRAILPPMERLCDISEEEFSGIGYRRFWSVDTPNVKADSIALSAQCPKIQTVISFIDTLYSTDYSVQSVFGGIADGVTVKNADFDFTVQTDCDFSNSFGEAGPHFLDTALQLSLPDSFVYAQLERNTYQKLPVKNGSYYPEIYMKYPNEQLKTLGEIEKKTKEIARKARLRWIRGEGDIEKEWKSYLEELEKAGLSSAIKIRQTAYNRYLLK